MRARLSVRLCTCVHLCLCIYVCLVCVSVCAGHELGEEEDEEEGRHTWSLTSARRRPSAHRTSQSVQLAVQPQHRYRRHICLQPVSRNPENALDLSLGAVPPIWNALMRDRANRLYWAMPVRMH